MRVIYVILFALLLSGCGSIGAAYDNLLTRGADYYDDALQGAVDVKCRVASGGAITRRYMRTTETWKTWTDECLLGGGRIMPDLPESETPVE